MVRGPGALELETNDCICDDMESHLLILFWGFPGGSAGKESTCNVGDLGSVPESGRSPGGGNGNPFLYSCLENSINRGVWWATVHRVTKSWTQLKQFSTHLTVLV